MQKQTIFYLEGRGGCWLYHFFLYNLGGLYNIVNQQYNDRNNDSVKLNNFQSKIVTMPTTLLTFPIKIYMTNVLPFQREAFEIIKNKFELVEDLTTVNYDFEIVSIYGALINYKNEINNNIYPYLRELFLENFKPANNSISTADLNHHEFTPFRTQSAQRGPPFSSLRETAPKGGVSQGSSGTYVHAFVNEKMCKDIGGVVPKKRIFITRKNSETQHSGVLKRAVINETEFMAMLQKYNFEYIKLENLNTYEKIKLFMQAEVILSSHGSALSFLLFADTTCKIIELLKNGTVGFPHDHFIDMCNALNLNYNRYQNINEDVYGNFEINVEEFEKYLLTLL